MSQRARPRRLNTKVLDRAAYFKRSSPDERKGLYLRQGRRLSGEEVGCSEKIPPREFREAPAYTPLSLQEPPPLELPPAGGNVLARTARCR